MTISQKIIATHAGLSEVRPGDIVSMDIDLVLGNDISSPMAIKKLADMDLQPGEAAPKIILVPDHFTPNKDVESAEQCRLLREFARGARVGHYFEVGRAGIEHALLPESGLVLPGHLIVGGDSHTCTYGAVGAFATGVGSTDLAGAMALGRTWLKVPETIRINYSGNLGQWVGGKDLILFTIGRIGTDGALGKTIEFSGPVIGELDIENRLTMANMAVEAGAVNGIMEPDEATAGYLEGRTDQKGTFHQSDQDAPYEKSLEIDVSAIEPQVALPHSPGNVVPVQECEGTRLDQVFIGSCTNGRIGDLRIAARILKDQKAAPGLRLLVSPATPSIYRQALREGLLEIFAQAEAVILPPTCGVCCGGHLGVLGRGEVCLSTTNRNFRGRMGHLESQVYLCGPGVAAASAVRGEITAPAAVV